MHFCNHQATGRLFRHIQQKNFWNMIYVYVIQVMGVSLDEHIWWPAAQSVCLSCFPQPILLLKVSLPYRDYSFLNFLGRLEHALKIDHFMIDHISIMFAMNVWIIKKSTSFHMTTPCILQIFNQNGHPFRILLLLLKIAFYYHVHSLFESLRTR